MYVFHLDFFLMQIFFVAAICWGSGKGVTVEEIQVDPPKATEIRVKMLCASICHTDISTIQGYQYVRVVLYFVPMFFCLLSLISHKLQKHIFLYLCSTHGLVQNNLQNKFPLALGHEGVG
jgi:Zn-dependent alcohol dehydrogenase